MRGILGTLVAVLMVGCALPQRNAPQGWPALAVQTKLLKDERSTLWTCGTAQRGCVEADLCARTCTIYLAPGEDYHQIISRMNRCEGHADFFDGGAQGALDGARQLCAEKLQ